MNLRKNLLLALCMASARCFCYAQEVDSLLSRLYSERNDSVKVSMLQRLASHYERSEYNSTQAENYLLEAKRLAENINNPYLRAVVYNQLGVFYRNHSRYSEAFRLHNDAYLVARTTNNLLLQAVSLNNLGTAYRRTDNYAYASEYHIKALKLAEEIKDSFSISVSLNSLGNIFSLNGRYNEAIDYFNRALRIAVNMQNKLGQAMNSNNIGEVYEFKKDYAKALEHYQKSLDINIDINNLKGIAINYNAIGNLELVAGNYQSAHGYFTRALEIDKALGDKRYTADTYANLARALLTLNRIPEAKKNMDSCLALAHQIKSIAHWQQAYELCSNYYKKIQRYDSALHYHILSSSYKDSLLSSRNSRQVALIQAIYETQKKENEIKLLTREQELIAKEFKRQSVLKNTFLVGLVLTIIVIVSIYQAFRIKQSSNRMLSQHIEGIEAQNIRLEEQKQEIETQSEQIEHQIDIIEEKNKNLEEAYRTIENYIEKITDNIRHAEIIQSSIQPSLEAVRQVFSDMVHFNKPKDIVSGDFFWMITVGNRTYLALSDCTGHGVPGAFMSMIGIALLNQAVNQFRYNKPDQIISFLNKQLTKRLHRSDTEQVLKDSMDIAVCTFDRETRKLEYSGALIPLFVHTNGSLTELKPDYIPLGASFGKNPKQFTVHSFTVNEGDWIYLSSDGYFDQLGGPGNKKFMRRQFFQLLSDIHQLPGNEQSEALEKVFLQWMGRNDQIDDVLVLGVRVM